MLKTASVTLILILCLAFSVRLIGQRLTLHATKKTTAAVAEVDASSAPWRGEAVLDPESIGASISGAAVERYEVYGNTIEEIRESLIALGPGHSGMAASTAYHLVLHKGDSSDGVCGYRKAFIQPEIRVLLPHWVPMSRATDETRQWWAYSFRHWVSQQQDHVNQALKEAQEADAQLSRGDCLAGETSYARLNQQLLAAHPAAEFPAAGSDIEFQTPGAIVEAVVVKESKEVLPAPARSIAVPVRTPMNFDGLKVNPMEGLSMPLEDSRGKVMFLNFWATWCGPCRSEMPSLASLYQKVKSDDLLFAVISNEKPDTVRIYLRNEHLDLPAYTINSGFNRSDLMSAVPTTYIISKKGDIAFKRAGGMNWDTPEILKLLRDLEAE